MGRRTSVLTWALVALAVAGAAPQVSNLERGSSRFLERSAASPTLSPVLPPSLVNPHERSTGSNPLEAVLSPTLQAGGEAISRIEPPNTGGPHSQAQRRSIDTHPTAGPFAGPIERNSSAVSEPGTIVGHYSGVTGWGTFDPQTGELFLTSSGSVVVWNGSAIIEQVNVTNGTTSAFDSRNGYVYVSDRGTDTVSVLNPSQDPIPVTNITNLTALNSPREVIYDAADGLVYVLSTYTAGFVTVINGTRVQGIVPIPGLGNGVSNEFYDSIDGDVYVSYNGAGGPNLRVAVINGTRVIGNLSLSSHGTILVPFSIAEDPGRGLLYFGTENGTSVGIQVVNATETNGTRTLGAIGGVSGGACNFLCVELGYNPKDGAVFFSDYTAGNISVIEGTRLVATLPDLSAGGGSPTSLNPTDTFYYPPTGVELVADRGGLGIISPYLSESTIAQPPTGNPPGTLDVGLPSSFSTTIWGIGTGNDSVIASTAPSASMSCNVGTTVLGDLSQATVRAVCVPMIAGNFSIWLNITDGLGTAWSMIAVEVYSSVALSPPMAIIDGLSGWSAADVNQSVQFQAVVDPGVSPNLTFGWTGIPPSAVCTGLTSANPSCAFFALGWLNISVTAIDGVGSSNQSPALPFEIFPRLLVPPLSFSPTAADVSQDVRISMAPEGGSGTLSSTSLFGATGASCSRTTEIHWDCAFATPGRYDVGATVVDTNGNSVRSSPIGIVIDSLPRLGALAANRLTLDVGQSLTFWANLTTGTSASRYAWQDLPGGCSSDSVSPLNCRPTVAGTYDVSAVVSDKNGGVSPPSTPVPVVVSSAPRIDRIQVEPVNPTVGENFWVNATVSGGSGAYTFAWSNLPPGCVGTTAKLLCHPTGGGTFRISLAATDGNGDTASSSAAAPTTVRPSQSPTHFSILSLGIPVLLGGAAVALAALVILAATRKRKKRRPSEGPDHVPASTGR